MVRSIFFLVLACAWTTSPANNEVVHRDMTDRAWHIALLLASPEYALDPAAAELRPLAQAAVPKYRSLPARLPRPKQDRCADLELIRRYGVAPNWGAPADFGELRQGSVPFPISISYMSGNDCGIDVDYRVGAFLEQYNTPRDRDYTGVVLGFWSQHPDAEEHDWHLQVRPTNMQPVATFKDAFETIVGGSAGAVYITARCLTTCIGDALSFLGTSGDCEACVTAARNDALNKLHEVIGDFDGLFPGFGDFSDAAVFGGLGHHLNIEALSPGQYDDRRGLLMEHAGPYGVPDALELALTVLIDWAGVSLAYDDSLGPKRYQIIGGADQHADSVPRDEDDWELWTLAHTTMTPVDNLAMFGWREFRKDPQHNVAFLGWALHAFGDAVAPHHLVGSFGYGHRPYEDAVEDEIDEYLFKDDEAAARTQAADIIQRTLRWRKFITDWRARHPQVGADVPVRDMITELARQAYETVENAGSIQWPYVPQISTAYLTPGVGEPSTKFYFRNAINSDPVNRNLLAEAIAAELAFLLSAAETLP